VKVIGLDPGQEAISKGEYELGFFNISEVRPYMKYAGPVPAPLQKFTWARTLGPQQSAAADRRAQSTALRPVYCRIATWLSITATHRFPTGTSPAEPIERI
jgi:hypothetical protein